MNHPELTRIGFVYTVELVRAGRVIERERVHNLMPLVGLNFLASALFKATAVPATWYLGLYEGNYTPQSTDTTTNFAGDADESTAYSESTRVAFVPGAVAAGAVDNSASVAVFTFASAATVYGGFISSVAAKSAVTGTLLSAVKFASPKTLAIADQLKVTAGLTFTSI